ncbi:MAG: hypothetical protein ACRCX8_19550 [Sarcina sp.]
MSDNNPSFETAPLKTKYIVDLDEFNEAIDSAEDKFKALAEAIQDITIKLNIASNIEDIRQSIDDIPDEKTIDIDIKSNDEPVDLGGLNEEQVDNLFGITNESIEKISESAKEMGETVSDSFEESADKAQELITRLDAISMEVEQISKMDNFKNLGGVAGFGEQLENLDSKINDVVTEARTLSNNLDIDSEAFEEITTKAGEISNSIFDVEESLKSANSSLADNADEIERTSSAYGEFMSKLAGLQIGLERLQEEDKLNGDINIRGVREAQEEISALKEQLSDLNVAMQESHEDGNLSDEAFESLGDSTSRTAQEMNDFNGRLDDTVTGFIDSVHPIHESGLNLKEYGEKMEESGRMASWNGMMINSMLSPIREVGEKCFSLGLTSETAMEIAGHAFGSNTKSVETWANNATRNFGITTGAALDSAEKFGFASKTMGANAKESASLGEEYTGLAAHIMLTSNGTMSFSQAQQMAMAVMQGQTYQTKRLGISFSNTALNAEALKLGFNKQFSALTPLQQATVRCHLAQIDLNKAYGTTNSLLSTAQGQWTQTKAKLESTGEVIGERLLPFVLKCAKGIEDLANWFTHLNPVAQDAILIIAGLTTTIGPLMMGIGLLKIAFGGMAKGAGEAEEAVAAVDSTMELCPIVAIATGIIVAITLLYEAWKHNWLGIRNITNDVVHDVANYIDWAKNHVAEAIEDILKIVIGLANPVIGVAELIKLGWDNNFLGMRTKTLAICADIKQDFERFGTDVVKFFDRIGTDIKNGFEDFKNSIENGASDLLHTIASYIENNPILGPLLHLDEAIVHLVITLGKSILELSVAALEALGRVIDTYLNKFLSWTVNILNKIGNAFEDGWNDVCTVTDRAFSAIGNAVSSHLESMVSALSAFGSDFVNGFEYMCNGAKSVFEDGISAVQSVWDSFTSWFAGVVSEPVQAIENIAGDMESAGSNIISSLWNGAESEWNGFINWITGGLNRVANWVSNETSHLLHDLDSVDGSHATGLSYVPWDGYRAELHRGEMVLTAEQSENYRNGQGTGGGTNITVNTTGADGHSIASEIEDVLRRQANGFL